MTGAVLQALAAGFTRVVLLTGTLKRNAMDSCTEMYLSQPWWPGASAPSSCSYLCPVHWSQLWSREWKCSWSSANRRCSNYIWVINNFIVYLGASYNRGLTVVIFILISRRDVLSISCECQKFGRRPHWSSVNISSSNGLAPSGNKPLSEPMFTQIYVRNAVYLASVRSNGIPLRPVSQGIPKKSPTKTSLKITSLKYLSNLLGANELTHCGLVTPYGDIDLGQHWLM